MGACRTVDPAREAGWQQAPCRGARSDGRDYVYFEHGMPVACDPERPATTQHTVRLSRLVELRRHAGSHPSRALCGVSRARRTRSQPDRRRCRSKFVFPVFSPFRLRVSHHLDHATFPAPATSNAACGFPRTTLSCLLRLKAYGTYPAGATFDIG